jgi:hypothetical protein
VLRAGSLVRWTGFADLSFADSAHLAFARACEHAMTDAHEAQPESWVIEDRRITFSADVESGPQQIDGTKRLLAALVLQALAGDAVIEVAQPPELPERWVLKAGTPSISKELVVGDGYDGEGETIRTAAS